MNEIGMGEQTGSAVWYPNQTKAEKNSNCAFQTLSKMHSLNLNCATQGEQLKNCFENSLGEFLGRAMREIGMGEQTGRAVGQPNQL